MRSKKLIRAEAKRRFCAFLDLQEKCPPYYTGFDDSDEMETAYYRETWRKITAACIKRVRGW